MRPIDADALAKKAKYPFRNERVEKPKTEWYLKVEDVYKAPTIKGTPVWISFDRKKPKHEQRVLGIDSEGRMEVYEYDKDWPECLCQYGGGVTVFNITHWMALPEPPKEEMNV